MQRGRYLGAALLMWGAIALAAPFEVEPLYAGKVVQTYAQEREGVSNGTVDAKLFPLKVFEESSDGGRFRVKVDGREAWVSKREVRPIATINVQEMCSTMVASAQSGATRNANEACRVSGRK